MSKDVHFTNVKVIYTMGNYTAKVATDSSDGRDVLIIPSKMLDESFAEAIQNIGCCLKLSGKNVSDEYYTSSDEVFVIIYLVDHSQGLETIDSGTVIH